jgi:hypothetical protein
VPLGVTVAHQAKGILVKAHPQMQPMLLDAIGDAAAGRTLSTEPPSHLIDGDLVLTLVLRACQLERRRQGGAASADHRHARWSL